MIDISKGITFIIRPIEENDNKVDSELPSDAPVLNQEKIQEFIDTVRRLSNDYGLIIDKSGQSDIIKKGICKTDRKAFEEKGFDMGVEQAIINFNLANKHNTPMIRPVYKHDELNKS
jgi:hypothetical protein